MVDCGEFHQGIRSEKIGRLIAVNFYNTLLVIVTVNCGEFLHTLLVIVTVNCGEFLKLTLSNCDGELR